MVIKLLIAGLIIFMLYSLIRALFVMTNPKDKSTKISTYIGRRLIAGIAIIILLLLGIATGVITPNPRAF